MPQDFRRANLQGRSFRGQNLSGADFSYADIRGADFSNTVLSEADFSYAQAGLQRHWQLCLIVGSLILAFIAGLEATYGGVAIGVLLLHQGIQGTDFLFSVLALIVLVGFGFTATRKGWGAETGGLAIIFATLIAFVTAVGTADAIGLAVIQAVAIAGVVAGLITGALATTVIRITAGRETLVVVLALFGTVAGALLGIPQDNAGAVILGAIAASITSFCFIVLSLYAATRALAGDQRYALIRLVATALCTSKGTSFRNADLTNATFTQATLKHTDLRGASLTCTDWFQSQGLNLARVGGTYLEQSEVRYLLVSKNGKSKNLDYCNLQGVNLQNANLADASLVGVIFSEATLRNADLSRAKLAQAQLYRTDLTHACLTGAYIQDWAISTDTNLKDIKCEYIYMRLPTADDPDPWRKPDNRQETFKEGDFEDFIAPIIKTLGLYRQQNVDPRQVANTFKTLDLYHYEGIDPSAAAIALKQLAEAHPEAGLEVVALEGRGEEKIRLQARVTGKVDQSRLSEEYFEKYQEVSALPYSDLQALLAGIEEKDERIRSLEKMVMTAISGSKSYIETVYNLGNTVTEKSAINIQAGGDIGNVSGVTGGDVSGVLNLGTISGNVTNAISQLPDSTEPDKPGLKELLAQLQAAIESESGLNNEDKAEALEQVKTLAEAGQEPENNALKKAAKTAMKVLKGTVAGLPNVTNLVKECGILIPAITTLLALI